MRVISTAANTALRFTLHELLSSGFLMSGFASVCLASKGLVGLGHSGLTHVACTYPPGWISKSYSTHSVEVSAMLNLTIR